MSEEKFASLSSGLLARKGGAKPAMRRQNYINAQGDVSEDLGWNDMGHDDEPHPMPVLDGDHIDAPIPEVRKQIDELAESFEADPDAVITPNLPEFDRESELNGESEFDGEDAVQSEAPPTETPQSVAPLTPAIANANGHAEPVHIEPAHVEPVEADSEIARPVTQIVKVNGVSAKPKKQLARDKAAFTLRLDKDRHLKLRLASAVSNRSAQQLVTEALDRFLETIPNITKFADTTPPTDRN